MQISSTRLWVCIKEALCRPDHSRKKMSKFLVATSLATSKGERGKVHIAVCNNQEVKQQILLLHKRIYGYKPNTGFFSIHFVHVAILWCQHDINIKFAEHVAKITQKGINKAPSNPWKLTLLALREQVQALLTTLAAFEAPILIGCTHQTATKIGASTSGWNWVKLRCMASSLSSVPPTALEQIEKTLDGLKQMIEQGRFLHYSCMLQHKLLNPLTCWNLGNGNN